ncbi:ATP synthase subunit I [Calidifontibacillus oryziterrae]|uniref:ATP synthase subunit I n=1 Tax=Calidifontibacillus oryziterrae TaxID=1191699 RepID=UPI0003179A8E|nr:ATP synthase subunit I [Calidifontibacillus oryziterrae]
MNKKLTKEYNQMFIRQLKMIINLLALFVIGWGFTPYPTIFLGLILGTVLSTYNLWTMHSKVNRLGETIVENLAKKEDEKKKKVRSLGSLQRLAAAALAVVIAMRYPDTFHFVSVIIGLMTYHFVIMIDLFFQSIKNK